MKKTFNDIYIEVEKTIAKTNKDLYNILNSCEEPIMIAIIPPWENHKTNSKKNPILLKIHKYSSVIEYMPKNFSHDIYSEASK